MKFEKKSFPLICRARSDESTDEYYQRFRIETKSSYSFEDRGTDGQTESISECTLKDLSNDIWHAYQSWKLVGDEENNIPPPLQWGGGITNSRKRTNFENKKIW